MTLGELKQQAGSFLPVLVLERVLPHRLRRKVNDVLSFVIALLALPALPYIVSIFSEDLHSFIFSIGSNVEPLLSAAAGLFLILFAVWFIIFLAETFYFSYYFKALDAVTGVSSSAGASLTFEAAETFSQLDQNDITGSFLQSYFGWLIMLRVGIIEQDFLGFINGRRTKLTPDLFSVDSESDQEAGTTIVDLAIALFKSDKEFATFLLGCGVDEKTLLGGALWVLRSLRLAKNAERWWSRERLGRIEGLGKDWAYGGAYILDRYSKSIFGRGSVDNVSSRYLREEVKELEGVLARAREANALVVGPTGALAYEVLMRLARLISEGHVLPSLEHKRVVVLDLNRLVAAAAEKSRFEAELIRIFEESADAGNIILVFDDLPAFIQSATALGSDVVSIMDPYLVSPNLQVVVISDTDRFHRLLEPNAGLMARFERILLKGSGEEMIIQVLEDEAARFEGREKIFFTYPALQTIARGADRYFPEGVMPDKAVDLMVEIIPKVKQTGKRTVSKEDILLLIEGKTGIPVGEVKAAERDKLVHLEELLHKRIVGQDEAIKAIGSALRRARSGLSNQDRPMGSFLFLGPTGVGKTETTKALAESFFGDESKIIRVDMSEYKGIDALDKLIGSFTTGRPGVLASKLRDQPYGVLLLDEFEKGSREVLDMFLAVLDEGFFSDQAGKRVSARNLIIIATSNAGADLIWQFMKQGGNLLSHKDEIIDALVKSGIFKPELLNRFDGVILFHPIVDENLRQVARMLLGKLAKRLHEKGIELAVTEDLVSYLMRFGSDPKFGARAMNRAVQDKVEQVIADKIIKGEIKPGQIVALSPADLGGV